MRKITEVEAIIDGRRRVLGISCQELALASVGSKGTWQHRMNDPLQLTHLETQRIFEYLAFTKEKRQQFYEAMWELAKEKV